MLYKTQLSMRRLRQAGLRGHTFKIHRQRSKTRRRQRWSSPVLEKTARRDFERSTRGDIQVAPACTVEVPLPKSSPLTCPPCSYCIYSGLSIVIFTAH